MCNDKSICECFPEGKEPFVGVTLGIDKDSGKARVFNINLESIVLLFEHEIQEPTVLDATSIDSYFDIY